MPSIRTYNPANVSVSFGVAGSAAVDVFEGGYTPGTFITVVKDNRRWVKRVDGRSNAVRIKQPGKGATVSLTIPMESPVNQTLSTLANADEISEAVVGLLLIKDGSSPNGATQVLCNGAFLDGIPDVVWTDGAGDMTWVFLVGEMTENHAGHESAI